MAAVKAPGFGDRRKGDAPGHRGADRRHGGERGPGIKFENLTLTDLGRAKRVSIDKDNTTIIDGAGKKADIEARIKQIRPDRETTSDYDRRSSRSASRSWWAAWR